MDQAEGKVRIGLHEVCVSFNLVERGDKEGWTEDDQNGGQEQKMTGSTGIDSCITLWIARV